MLFYASGLSVGSALLWLGAGLAALAAIGGVMILMARRRGETAIMLSVTRSLSIFALAVCALSAAASVTVFFAPELSVTLPVSVPWPDPLPGHDDVIDTTNGAVLSWANLQQASVGIAGLSIGTRAMLFGSAIAAVFVFAAPAIALLVLTTNAREGAPFAAAVSRWFFIAAITVFVAGLGMEFLNQFGTSFAAHEVFFDDARYAAPTVEIAMPAWPIGAALGLAALAAVFRHGLRLQRDAEGLV